MYAVCRKHDVYIIEDEPYYFLHMPPYESGRSEEQDKTTPASTSSPPPQDGYQEGIDAFTAALAPTYLSMDTDGRVMRMDSFSKIVVPGSRLGWITASQQIVEQYVRHAECASQGPSGLSQLVLYKLVDETWGHGGFLRWLMHLSREYTRRRDILLGACERELGVLRRGGGVVAEEPNGRGPLVKWVVPSAGMFVSLSANPVPYVLAILQGQH